MATEKEFELLESSIGKLECSVLALTKEVNKNTLTNMERMTKLEERWKHFESHPQEHTKIDKDIINLGTRVTELEGRWQTLGGLKNGIWFVCGIAAYLISIYFSHFFGR